MMEVPTQLKQVVDSWVCQHPMAEVGGTLFGDGNRLEAFLPLPNIAQDQRHQYTLPSGAGALENTMAEFLGRTRRARLHSHPNGTAPSKTDMDRAASWACPWWIIVSPNDSGRCAWTILDKRARVVEAIYPDVPLESACSLLAQRLGLLDLGRCYIDNHGNVHSEQNGAGILLDDPNARRIWTMLCGQTSGLYRGEIADEARAMGMSGAAAKRATDALIAAGLADSGYYDGIRVVRDPSEVRR